MRSLRNIARHVVLKRKFSVPRPSAAALCSRALEGKICPNQDRQIDLAQFNPKNEAWLPVLHTDRGNWHFSVLYSNTALAINWGKCEIGWWCTSTTTTTSRGNIRW